MACLIKTPSLVVSSSSRMTSDLNISHVIIIHLRVVFLLLVSSRFALLIVVLMLLLIGLGSWFLTSFSWVSGCWSSVNLSRLTRGSTSWTDCLNVYLFTFFSLRYLSHPSLYSCLHHFTSSTQPHPSASRTFPDSAGRLYQNSNLSGP